MIEDFGLIVSSFQSQYGLRLSRELKGMSWDEFRDLLVGLDHKTALGRVVSIRAESDPDIIKEFTPDQRRIRNEWLENHKKEVNVKDRDDFLARLLEDLKGMSTVRKAGE